MKGVFCFWSCRARRYDVALWSCGRAIRGPPASQGVFAFVYFAVFEPFTNHPVPAPATAQNITSQLVMEKSFAFALV